ncbi:TRAP transporter substrate-binding protein [Roseomonas eburnea]|uniref:TRAP transporter substrate-binding protein n=1 Tax=Neoroseomonas eburnea TaxID=1346889 RepID=A0A9X9X9Q1_9PROT|nr:TRAP transporter substrate-binding protein [Neoroseomonas eburnea]MBR0680437.1 TRAP transporter substrate-binding protein [Neoroseomonas eburnea]
MLLRRSVLAAAMLAMGCGGALAQTRWTMATAYAEGNFHTRNIRAFAEEVERGTEGRLSIQLHPGASLLQMPSIKRGVQTGQIQMGEVLLSVHGNEDPFFEVDSVPFLADTWDATAALDRTSMPFIRARLERQGIVPLYAVPWPSQAFYTRTEIRAVEDLRGLRFRTYNVLTTRMAELLGAAPVTVQVAEIPQAFATGVIAAMFTSAQTGVDTSAWDYARYFTDVGGMRARNFIIVNARAFRALDEATRDVLTQAAERAAARGLDAAKAAETEMVERLRARGMQVGTPSPQFLAQLREIGVRQTREWAQRAGPEGTQLLAAYRAAIPR